MKIDVGQVHTVSHLLAIARAMELSSAERYRELAEAFEVSCNMDTSAAFSRLAEIEDRHAADFPADAVLPDVALPFLGEQAMEIADPDAVHYLMHPWHAFSLALRHEENAQALFLAFSSQTSVPEVRDEAQRLAERERGHIATLGEILAETPRPPKGWYEAGDPPNWDCSE